MRYRNANTRSFESIEGEKLNNNSKHTNTNILEGWESLDAVGIAQRLPLRSAVHFSDQFAFVARESLHEFVPSRSDLLAVPAPGRVELKEHRLAHL